MPLRYRGRAYQRQLRADSVLVEQAISEFPDGIQLEPLAEHLNFDQNYVRKILISLTQRGKVWRIASDSKRWNPVWTTQPQKSQGEDGYSLEQDDEHRHWLKVAAKSKITYNPWGAV